MWIQGVNPDHSIRTCDFRVLLDNEITGPTTNTYLFIVAIANIAFTRPIPTTHTPIVCFFWPCKGDPRTLGDAGTASAHVSVVKFFAAAIYGPPVRVGFVFVVLVLVVVFFWVS